MKHPHDPQYLLTDERRAVVDDVCLYTVTEAESARRAVAEREARTARLHLAAIAAKAAWDASGSPADEVAFNEAFERWIGS